jgi:hypothetical protein
VKWKSRLQVASHSSSRHEYCFNKPVGKRRSETDETHHLLFLVFLVGSLLERTPAISDNGKQQIPKSGSGTKL